VKGEGQAVCELRHFLKAYSNWNTVAWNIRWKNFGKRINSRKRQKLRFAQCRRSIASTRLSSSKTTARSRCPRKPARSS